MVAAGILGLAGATALGLGKDEGERLAFVGLTTGFTLATAAVEMAIFHHQAQLSFVRAGILEVVRSGLILLMACGAIVGLFETGAAVALAFDVSVGLMALVVTLPVAFSTMGAVRGQDGRFGFGRETVMLTVYSVSSAGWAYLDVFLVAALLNDVAVASYGAAIRYISVVMGPVPALIAVFRVRTSQRDMVDSDSARSRLLSRWVRQTALPAVLLTGLAAIAAIWAIPLVDGGRYPLSVPIFQILLVVTFVQYLLLPAPGLLIAQKRYKTLAWVNASALVVNVAVAVALAPLMGVVGVALAGTICGSLQAGTVAFLAVRKRRRWRVARAGAGQRRRRPGLARRRRQAGRDGLTGRGLAAFSPLVGLARHRHHRAAAVPCRSRSRSSGPGPVSDHEHARRAVAGSLEQLPHDLEVGPVGVPRIDDDDDVVDGGDDPQGVADLAQRGGVDDDELGELGDLLQQRRERFGEGLDQRIDLRVRGASG